MSRFRILTLFFSFLVCSQLLSPRPVYALQAHSYIGLYVHQGAHLFFLLAMLSFTFRIHLFGLTNRLEWRWISKGAWLLALWNIWAFSGHIVELYIPSGRIKPVFGEIVPSLAVFSWLEGFYYFLKMDHLLSVPAMLCFYIGIKTLLRKHDQSHPSIQVKS